MLLISSSTNFWVSNFTENTQKKTVSTANNTYIRAGLQPEINMPVSADRLDSWSLITINQNQNALHYQQGYNKYYECYKQSSYVLKKAAPWSYLIIMSNFMSKVVSLTHV